MIKKETKENRMTTYDRYREEHANQMSTENGKNMVMNWTDESVKRMMKKDEEKHWMLFASYNHNGKDIREERHDITNKRRYIIPKNNSGAYIRYSLD